MTRMKGREGEREKKRRKRLHENFHFSRLALLSATPNLSSFLAPSEWSRGRCCWFSLSLSLSLFLSLTRFLVPPETGERETRGQFVGARSLL